MRTHHRCKVDVVASVVDFPEWNCMELQERVSMTLSQKVKTYKNGHNDQIEQSHRKDGKQESLLEDDKTMVAYFAGNLGHVRRCVERGRLMEPVDPITYERSILPTLEAEKDRQKGFGIVPLGSRVPHPPFPGFAVSLEVGIASIDCHFSTAAE
jgi:hypothetical protein